MKHALFVTAVAEVSADMVAHDFPAPDVCWHQKALPNRLVVFGEAQPWFSSGLGSVRFMVGLDDLKGLFQPK